MKHLSGLDATFLHFETPEMPMHVGSLNVLELPKGYKGDFYEDAKAFMASRIHLADVFTRKLALMPFDLSNPVWVDDDDIDIDYHVRHITLPKPGTNRQLQQYVARLHSTLLDRSRPLWELFVIDGLKSGQVALYAKVHHAGIDGQGGVAVAIALAAIYAEQVIGFQPQETMVLIFVLNFAAAAGAFGKGLIRHVPRPGDNPATMRALARAMELMGAPVPEVPLGGRSGLKDLEKVKNVAMVMVNATVPATGARAEGASFWAAQVGPTGVLSGSLGLPRRLVLDLQIEGGYLLTPAYGLIDGAQAVALAGPWLGLQLGLGVTP